VQGVAKKKQHHMVDFEYTTPRRLVTLVDKHSKKENTRDEHWKEGKEEDS